MGRGERNKAVGTAVTTRRGQSIYSDSLNEKTAHLDNGKIKIINSTDDLKDILKEWKRLGPQPIALDLECAASPTVPNGSGLHPHLGTIRLMQLAIADNGSGEAEALVINARQVDMREAMKLIEDPEWPTLVHYAQMETRWLGYTYGKEIGGLIDTCRASQLIDADADGHNLGAVVSRQLDTELSKEQQNSYWDAVELSEEQLEYAGKDVLALLDVWKQMEGRLSKEDKKDLRGFAKKLNQKAVSLEAKGCESARAIEMIRASRSIAELEKLENQGLAHMRIHHSNNDKVKRALKRAKRRIEEGDAPRRPVKVKVASWRQPF